jgi:4-amino-4-deoxy-L-arabinose transferase-like glycosyltransferase
VRRKKKIVSQNVISTTARPKLPAGEIFCCLLIIALCLAIGLPRYLVSIDLCDEGFLAYGATQVMNGQVPNRDFVSLQPPLSFYTSAAVFKLFGTSLVSLRTLGLCFYILIALLVYGISRNITGRILSFLAAISATIIGMPLFNFVPYAVWHGILATLIAVFLFMRAMANGRRLWAFLAGLATAAAILSRHDQGLYLVAAVLIYVWAAKHANYTITDKPHIGRMLGFWAAGTLAIMLPLVVYWLVCGAAPYMFKQLVVFLLTRYAKTSSLPMPVFHPELPLRENIIVVMFYLPLVVCALAAIWIVKTLIRRRFRMEHAGIGFLLIISLLFYLQVLTRSDLHHLVITLPPFFILCAWCTDALVQTIGNAIEKRLIRRNLPASRGPKTAVLLTVGTFIVLLLLYMKSSFMDTLETYRTVLPLNRGGVRLEPEYVQSLSSIVKVIQSNTEPNDAILCLPYAPMFYFLSDRRNPTQWNYFWPGDQTVEDHLTFVKQAKNDPPAIVITIDSNWVQVNAPVIYDYIIANYKVAHDLDPITIYLPLNTQNNQ